MKDHRKCRPDRTQARALERGQADRGKATAPAKARLVDPHQATDRGADARPGNVQSGIDSKLRGCDVVALKVEDVVPSGYAVDRATVRQKKTGQPSGSS